MWYKIKAILIRSIPYVFCSLCGIGLFLIGIYFIDNDSFRSLTTSLAGTLLGIPVVFLVFHSTDYYTKKALNKKLAKNLVVKTNETIDKMLRVLWKSLGIRDKMTPRMIRKTASVEVKKIQDQLKITPADLLDLKSIKRALDELEYSATRLSVLSDNQNTTIVSLAQEMAHLINEREFQRNKKAKAITTQKILILAGDWYDSNKRNRSNSEQSLEIAMDKSEPDKK